MGGETPNSRKMPIFYILIFVVFLLWFGFCTFLYFVKGLSLALTVFLIGLFVGLLLSLIVFIIFWLFKKHRIDMLHIAKQRIVKACELHRLPHKQEFRSRGSAVDNISWSVLGYITGICIMKTNPKFKIIEEEDEVTGYKIKKKELLEESKDLIIISFNQGKPFPLSLFDDTQLFLGYPTDLSNPSAAVVYANGILAPEILGVYFLAKHFEKTYMIDESLKDLVYRYMLQENLSEIKNIVDDAIAISPEHQKRIERSNLETFQPQQQTQQGK